MTPEYFLTVDDAEEKLRSELACEAAKVCPAFKCECKVERCQSFFKGTILSLQDGTDRHKVYPPHCQSPLVTGTIYHEEN